ncbi:MAG: hypothetical protein KAG97_05905 [Victivallales bacterium]|nr:hypothetical protein [Victivallales bacterium]
MRYSESGEVHLDFHAATNTAMEHVGEKFGDDALCEIMYKVGHDVYKSIRLKLADGDTGELVEFWNYFLKRENGEFTIEKKDDEIILTITKCPAAARIKELGHTLSPHFCKQTEYMNIGLCDGTPFVIETRKTGEASCVQILRKRTEEDAS